MNTLPAPLAEGRTAEIYPWQDGTILKLYRVWCPPHWVEDEARIAGIVTDAGIPSPRAFEIVEVDGRRGLVYERLEGVSMLTEMTRQPHKLLSFARTLADLQLRVHQCTAPDLPEMHSALERAITTTRHLPGDLRTAAYHALEKLPEGDRLCHGDYHPDNVLITPKGPVIIDWMTASRGDLWADVARTHLLLRLGQPTGDSGAFWLLRFGRQIYYQTYIARYTSRTPSGKSQLQAWLPVMAAARLNEDIPHERAALIDLVRKGLLS